jgi:hypothetical protein
MRKRSVFSIIGGLILFLSNSGAFGQGKSVDSLSASDVETGMLVGKAENIPVPEKSSGPVNGVGGLSFSGWGSMTFGQIEHGYYGVEELNHRWQELFQSQLNALARVNERLSVSVGTEICYQYSTTAAQTNGPSYLPGINIILNRADMDYKILEGNFPLSLQAGYFPFKYNPESRNLGEYLFRTGCYPTFIVNNFDFPLNRLLGFNIDNTLLADNEIFSMHNNFLITSEAEVYPYQDISLSYLGTLGFWRNVFKVGGGICGQRMFSVNESYTTPHSTKTIAEVNNRRTVTDTLSGATITIGDTTFFSFAGTKVVAHMTIDPKPLIPVNIFGSEDFKIYGEIAWLGIKNYPVYVDSANGIGIDPKTTTRYDVLSERMPIMLGFDFPTFKVLDVLSFEFEYFNNRYYNSYYNEYVGNGIRLPLPYIQARGDQTGIDSTWAGNVKWSVYAKKTIGKNIQIIAQFARDHRHAIINLSDPRYGDYGDNLSTVKDWYYLFKLMYSF